MSTFRYTCDVTRKKREKERETGVYFSRGLIPTERKDRVREGHKERQVLTGNGDEQEEYPRIHESADGEEAAAAAGWEGSPPVHHAPRRIAYLAWDVYRAPSSAPHAAMLANALTERSFSNSRASRPARPSLCSSLSTGVVLPRTYLSHRTRAANVLTRRCPAH